MDCGEFKLPLTSVVSPRWGQYQQRWGNESGNFMGGNTGDTGTTGTCSLPVRPASTYESPSFLKNQDGSYKVCSKCNHTLASHWTSAKHEYEPCWNYSSGTRCMCIEMLGIVPPNVKKPTDEVAEAVVTLDNLKQEEQKQETSLPTTTIRSLLARFSGKSGSSVQELDKDIDAFCFWGGCWKRARWSWSNNGSSYPLCTRHQQRLINRGESRVKVVKGAIHEIRERSGA
jgi:hypothetical protein